MPANRLIHYRPPVASPAGLLNALTFDVEDWYQGIEIGPERWCEFERRLERGLSTILDSLDAANCRATFFVLGQCALDHPELIAQIAQRGHELGTHGQTHTKVYDLPLGQFEEELIQSIEAIEQASGVRVQSHRAPYFSVTQASYKALGVMRRNGILIDASIYPGRNYRYGIPGTPASPYRIDEFDLIEFPVSVIDALGRKLGLGGAYFRILPYPVTRRGIARLNAAGQPASFYAHPWEFDPFHPRVRFRRTAQATHYFNLISTPARLRQLLQDFRFGTMSRVLTDLELLAPTAPVAA